MSDYKELCERLRAYAGANPADAPRGYQYASLLLLEAADAIESQAAEIAALRKTVHLAWNERDEVMRENDALRARAEAAEKDAARYRYLRTPTDVTKRPEPLQVMHWLDTGPAHCEGEQLDRCVDAAIAAGGDDAKD